VSVKDRVMRGITRVALAKPAVDLIGRRRQRGDDATLDPQVAAVLELQRMLKLPALDSMEPVRARRFAEAGLSPLDVPTMSMQEIVDTKIGSTPVRIYTPHDATKNWIVYLHGGGGVIGSIRASEPITRLLAAQTRCTVASVDYRLAPEHKHPAAIEDAVAAWDALMPRVLGRAAVAGDSFGGFLSAQVDRAAKRKPDLQVLIYPMVDLTYSSPSIERHADGYLLTRSMIHWFRSHYLHHDDDRKAASPHYWPSLRGAAPAIVVTAGFDPLVDEGDAHVARLRAAGCEVVHRRYPGLIHGFLSLGGGVRAARAAIDELCADIRAGLVR
jgi:acetyl esterase